VHDHSSPEEILMLSKTSDGSPHHVKNSADTIRTLDSACAELQDIMVNFNAVSLFTRLLIKEAMSFLRRYFEDTLRLFCHVLTSLYFSFSSQLYQETESMAMGLPLSPDTANFFIKNFKENGI
jgi:hypothetical protein